MAACSSKSLTKNILHTLENHNERNILKSRSSATDESYCINSLAEMGTKERLKTLQSEQFDISQTSAENQIQV